MMVITAFRDLKVYDRFVRKNEFCHGENFIPFDNRAENKPISVCYNQFLDSYDYSQESWFVFCHEDFELQENISPLLDKFDRSALHGVVGGARCGLVGFGMQVIYGNMTEWRRDGEGDEWYVGKHIERPVEVEAFDCCCLIVHSSLIQKFHLRFDEHLLFDLYVEDFCAAAKVFHGIRSLVHPVKCCHHSGSRATERLDRHLPYLKEKYPHNCFVGTLVYFGTPNWQKRLQDWVMTLIRKDSNMVGVTTKRPDVSIVLLTWNRAPFLEICLREMFASFDANLSREIILMDNCSDDATPDILARYSARPNVRVVRNQKNLRLNAYKKLFAMARGRFVIEVDDDILRFPHGFDSVFLEYFLAYPDYGYLALNVERNEKTNGAKPPQDYYVEDERNGKIVEEGPAGGWCAAFRRIHYLIARPILAFLSFSMARPEDGVLMGVMKKLFQKRIGIIKEAVCLHAVGPAYAKLYGLMKREREKYEAGNLKMLADQYCETSVETYDAVTGVNGVPSK